MRDSQGEGRVSFKLCAYVRADLDAILKERMEMKVWNPLLKDAFLRAGEEFVHLPNSSLT